MKSGIYNYD